MQETKLCTQNNANIFAATLPSVSPMGLLPQNTCSELISIKMKVTGGLNFKLHLHPIISTATGVPRQLSAMQG